MKHVVLPIMCGMCAMLAISCGSQEGTITETQSATDSTSETEAVTEALLYPEYELDLGGEDLHMLYFDAVRSSLHGSGFWYHSHTAHG